MKAIALAFRLTLSAGLSSLAVAPAMAEEAPSTISTPQNWSERVLANLSAADYDQLELLLLAAMDDRGDQIRALLGQFRAWVGDRQVVYSDLLRERRLGTSMEQRVYAVYYGERRFMYVSMVFARGEGNWLVMAFNLDTEVDNLLRRLD